MKTIEINKICQSCGMPINKDPNEGGTNADKSKSQLYCSYCYADGQFLDEGITIQEKIDKNVKLASASHHIPEVEARQIAEQLLPNLKRWKEL